MSITSKQTKKTAGGNFETPNGGEGFEFVVEGGADAVNKFASMMETVEQDIKVRRCK